MPRMRRPWTRVGPAFLVGLAGLLPSHARADLIRPDASQTFPDVSGDVVGTQSYQYDPTSGTGVFRVNSAPSLLALGPKLSDELAVTDPSDQSRGQTIQIKLDGAGKLVSDPGNFYRLVGSVTIDGQLYSGVLLSGTPNAFGYLPQQSAMGEMSVYDLHMNVSGGRLKSLFGPEAYVRIIAESNSTFDGTFTRSSTGSKTLTNVRASNGGVATPVAEPSTFVVAIAFGGAGLIYHRRRRQPLLEVVLEDEG